MSTIIAGGFDMLADAERAVQRLGEAGRSLYLENFTWPAAWRKLEEAAI